MQAQHLRLVHRLLRALSDEGAAIAHRFLSPRGLQLVTGGSALVVVQLAGDFWSEPLSFRFDQTFAVSQARTLPKLALARSGVLELKEHTVKFDFAKVSSIQDAVKVDARGSQFQARPTELVELLALSYAAFLWKRLDGEGTGMLRHCQYKVGYADGKRGAFGRNRGPGCFR